MSEEITSEWVWSGVGIERDVLKGFITFLTNNDFMGAAVYYYFMTGIASIMLTIFLYILVRKNGHIYLMHT